MIEPPQIVHTQAQPAAVIRLTIPRAEMQTVMGPAIAEVIAVLAEQGREPAGPVFAHHLSMDPDRFDFEVGFPIDGPVSPAGRVILSQLPAATVARTVYQGPYEGLPDAWGQLMAWIAAEGHEPCPNLWERYVVQPDANPDPAAWRTELNRPIKP